MGRLCSQMNPRSSNSAEESAKERKMVIFWENFNAFTDSTCFFKSKCLLTSLSPPRAVHGHGGLNSRLKGNKQSWRFGPQTDSNVLFVVWYFSFCDLILCLFILCVVDVGQQKQKVDSLVCCCLIWWILLFLNYIVSHNDSLGGLGPTLKERPGGAASNDTSKKSE